MSRRAWIVFSLVALYVLSSCSTRPPCRPCHVVGPPDAIVEHAPNERASTYTVLANCPDGVQYGTAALVSPTQVLTARHVIECDESQQLSATIMLKSEDGNPMRAVIEYVDSEADVARLAFVDYVAPRVYAKLGPLPERDDVVCYSAAEPMHERNCALVQTILHDVGWVWISYTAKKGNSGSGVYDLHGRIVGILVRVDRNGRDGSIFDFRIAAAMEGVVQ